jgi:hypothetical protein
MAKNNGSLRGSTSNVSLRGQAGATRSAVEAEFESTRQQMAALRLQLQALEAAQNREISSPSAAAAPSASFRGSMEASKEQSPSKPTENRTQNLPHPSMGGYADFANSPNLLERLSKGKTQSIQDLVNEPSQATLFGGFEAALGESSKSEVEHASVNPTLHLSSVQDDSTASIARQWQKDVSHGLADLEAYERLRFSPQKLALAKQWQRDVLKGYPDVEAFLNSRFKDLGEKVSQLKSSPLADVIRPYVEQVPKTVEEPKVMSPADYTKPFCDFLTENPTVFHAVDYFGKKLTSAGFKKVCTRFSFCRHAS